MLRRPLMWLILIASLAAPAWALADVAFQPAPAKPRSLHDVFGLGRDLQPVVAQTRPLRLHKIRTPTDAPARLAAVIEGP